jgi:hypothetical protein
VERHSRRRRSARPSVDQSPSTPTRIAPCVAVTGREWTQRVRGFHVGSAARSRPIGRRHCGVSSACDLYVIRVRPSSPVHRLAGDGTGQRVVDSSGWTLYRLPRSSGDPLPPMPLSLPSPYRRLRDPLNPSADLNLTGGGILHGEAAPIKLRFRPDFPQSPLQVTVSLGSQG